MKKTLLFVLLALLLPLVANAYDFESGGIYYNFNSDGTSVTVTYKTTSYNSYSGSVVIPSTVTYNDTEYSVTSIGSDAFCACRGLTSVTIPNSVTSIGYGAFYGCSGLTKAEFASIESLCKIEFGSSANPLYYAKHLYINGQEITDLVIPNSVTSIGGSVFYNCSSLTSVTIPESVTSIGTSAFYNCSGLTSVTIPNSVTSIGKSAFYGCSGLTSVTIGNSVTSIGHDAFYNCSGLTSVTINSNNLISKTYTSSNNLTTIFGSQVKEYILGDDIKSIGNYAFYNCSGLTSVTIPNSVTSIGYEAFYNCSGLTSVTIPNSVTSIGNRAFYGCSGLKSVTINSNNLISKTYTSSNNLTTIFGSQVKEYILGDDIKSIGNYAFYNCSSLTSITIPNSVTSIGGYAFSGCSGLTSVTIPNSVTSIGGYAFSGCSGLTSVTIPNSVTSIGERVFNGCTNLTFVAIPNSVTSIGASAFYNCSNLIYVVIPNSVTSIGYRAFYGCSDLTSINIGNSVTSIGNYAFSNCSGLTSVTIPNSVTSIGEYALSNCSGLTSVTIGNSVTSIGASAFYNCSCLTSITIPNSVTSIGSYAFYGCSGLTSVTIPNSVTSIGQNAFSNCSGLTKAEFASIESLCKIQFGNNESNPLYNAKHLYIDGQEITDLVIPESVTSIGSSAFYGFSGLTSITIPNSVTSIGSSAFYNCSGLTKAEFASIESLCKINFGSSNANPLYYAKHLYINGQEITDLVIPESVTSIGEYAFNGCTGLTSITIPNSVTSIGSYAFKECPLQTIINRGNKDVKKDTFYDRVYLHTQLYVPEGTVWDYIFNTGWGEFHHIKEFASKADDIRNDAVYMIADRSGRNFPVYDKATKSLKNVAYTMNIDDNDTGACWQVKKNGGDTYLYNIGAGMYASYDVDNNLALSIAPTAVNIEVTEDGATINGRPVMLVANKSLTPVGPEYILGDANGNGEVEIGDVTSVLTLMATPEATGYNNKAADANGNGVIEIGDVTTILTIMAGGN